MIIESSIKSISFVAVGLVALVGATGVPSDDDGIIAIIERTGSFGLLALFFISIIYGLQKLIPIGAEYINRNRVEFLAEIKEEREARERGAKEEREARERGMKDHREMLQGHKHDLIATMDKQTIVIEKQTQELDRIASLIERKPCILRRTAQGDYIEP